MKLLKVIPLLCVFALTGCNNQNYIICTLDISNDIQNYNVVGNYKIYYNDKYVTSINTKET